MARTSLTYTVPDISCAHCVEAITGEVGDLEGVEAVDVDIDSKQVTIVGERLDDDAVRQAIAEAGYDVAA